MSGKPKSARTVARSGLAVIAGLLVAVAAQPSQAEELQRKTLHFTTISVPEACKDVPLNETGMWRCTMPLDQDRDLNVQLDEVLVPMERISTRRWTNEDVVATLTGPVFQNWMKGATARTPDNKTRWQVVAAAELPAGIAACNEYRFDRSDPATHRYFIEIGRYCVLTRDPVQWPYILVGSVSLRNFRDRGAPFPDEAMALARTILSTFQLSHP